MRNYIRTELRLNITPVTEAAPRRRCPHLHSARHKGHNYSDTNIGEESKDFYSIFHIRK